MFRSRSRVQAVQQDLGRCKFEAMSTGKDKSCQKPAKDLKDVLGQLGLVMSEIRTKLAVAECIENGDEMGKLPAEIEQLIQKADTHLDGIKAMKKRLSANFLPPMPGAGTR